MKVPKLASYINHSQRARALLKGINRNPAIYNTIAAFGFAACLRPTFIGLLPFKDKKDKQYSQASSIAAGAIELISSVAIFLPLNKVIRKSSDQLFTSNSSLFRENAQALRQFKSITNRGIKALTLIPVSFARFALVKPIVNLIFGDKK